MGLDFPKKKWKKNQWNEFSSQFSFMLNAVCINFHFGVHHKKNEDRVFQSYQVFMFIYNISIYIAHFTAPSLP